MRVKMLVDAPGSPDGITILQYDQGTVYDVPDDLGAVFVAEEFAAETDEDVTANEELELAPDDEAATDETEQAEAEVEQKLDAGPQENK